MGATASSTQRDSRCEEDAAAEQRTAASSDAADDTLLQRNGQISNQNTKNPADEVNEHFEERILADVCSRFVTVKEDGTETIEDLQDVVSLQPNTKNEGRDVINEDNVTMKEKALEIKEVNTINEVGFKKVFRFVGFKFTLKKDTCEKTEGEGPLANDQEEKVGGTSEDSKENDAKEKNTVAANIDTPDELLKSEETGQPEAENETQLDQDTGMQEHNVEVTPKKEEANVVETNPESEEPMSPFKQFFTQGIFGSLRKKKKEDEMQKETKEEELTIINKIVDAEMSERDEKVDTKCMCLDIPYIMHEDKDSQTKGSKLLPEEELQYYVEKETVQASPLKRLFRKFSSRRQRDSKAVDFIEDGDKVTEQPEPSLDFTDIQKEKEPVVGEPKPAVEEQLADVSPQESKKKSDSSVSWEALICGSSAKKRARKTTAEGETADNEKTTESPLGSSIEGDYEHLTSSTEQDGEGESGSTWKTFKKMVTPKKKARTGDSSSSEHIPSDSEMNKDDSFSVKKLIAGCKKRKSNGRQEQTSSDETGKDAETGDEDDETPAIIPLSEYEIVEPEIVKEVNEQQVEITIEHEMSEGILEDLEPDTPNESEPKLEGKVSNNAGPLIIRVLSEDFEEVTDFMSKYQQLSDIPEEGIIEESIETPISSAEWTTQDDTLAEDIVDLTADAVTAPEPASEELIGDNSTEMVSALSQLTESPRTSGHVTPVSAEYGVQMSNVIFQEAVQSLCITPSVQSVTTKDKSQESLAVSFTPYIIQTSTPGETKVFVAHMKTDATAICTGLTYQEIEFVEEILSAPLVEATPEVSDAVPTELVYENLTDALEVAGLGTDEVYEAEVWDVKTEFHEVIITIEEEAATETELDVEQVIQQLAEPLMEAADESHVGDKKEEWLIQHKSVEMSEIDKMQSKVVLDQVISEHTHGPETDGPLHSLEEQPVHNTEITVEVEEDSTELEDEVHIEKAKVDSVLEVVSAGDSALVVEDICEKMEKTSEEKNVQHITDAEQRMDDVALEVDQNIEIKHILEIAAESLAREESEERQLHIASTEMSLLEKVLVGQTAKVDKVTTELGVSPKEIDTDLDNIRGGGSASAETEDIGIAVKDVLLFTKTESDESENQEVPEITEQDVVTDNVETAHSNTVPDVSEISFEVVEHKEITDPGDSSKVILRDLESVMPQNEARELETDEWSQKVEHSPETTEKVKIGEVLEIVAITENPTKQSEKEEPEVHAPTISELPKTTEQEEDTSTTKISAESIDDDQLDQATIETAIEMKETAIPVIKDEVSDVTKLEPESTQSIEIEVTVTAVSESVKMARNDAAMQMENNIVTEQKETEETMLKCKSPEFLEKTLATELQVDKTESKDEEDASSVTTPEVAPIVQVPPRTSEMKAETPEVTVPEIQTQEPIEVTEPKIETPVVAEDKLETAVVTELCVDTIVVTSVVSELEVETPAVTSIAETLDTHASAVTSWNQNTYIDTSMLTAVVIKNQGVEVATVTPVTTKALDLVTPVVTLDNKSVVEAQVEDTSVETLVVEEPPVESVVDPVEEGSHTVEVTAAGMIAETVAFVEGPVLEPQAVFVSTVKPTEALVASAVFPVLEMPNVTQVVEAPTVDSAVEASTVITAVETQAVVLVTEAEPPEVVTPAETQVAETSVVSPLVETSVFSFTSAITTVTAMADALVVTPVDEISALVSETIDPLAGTLCESPVEETPAVIPTAIASSMDSMTVTHIAMEDTPLMIPPVIDGLMETSPGTPVPEPLQVTPERETPAVAPVVVTSAVASIVVTMDVMPGVKETKSEPTVEAEDHVKPPPVTEEEVMTSVLSNKCISTEENTKGSLQQIPMVTSPEPQLEVEDDVWEDSVDSIGDGRCQMMETDVTSPQDTAVKQGSDVVV